MRSGVPRRGARTVPRLPGQGTRASGLLKHRPRAVGLGHPSRLDEIRPETTERGLSAYVTEALRLKRDRDRLLELVGWLEDEHGPVTEDEHAAALKELAELDAEHARRRAESGSIGTAA